MEIVRFSAEDGTHLGRVESDMVVDLGAASGSWLADLLDSETLEEDGPRRQSRDLRLVAPLAPGKIICSGINFRSHLNENPKASLPTRPFFFAKLTSAVIGPGDPIVQPYASCGLDYEVELAIVIGRTMRRVSSEAALDHIFGYTILNDVSARDLQFAADGQFTLGKGLDTFCPLGPSIITAKDVGDPSDLALATTVNGEVRQDGSTRDWIFPLPVLLSELSEHVTLEPGDVVSTGTPAGVAHFLPDRPYLRPGDMVTVSIERLGSLTNPVISR